MTLTHHGKTVYALPAPLGLRDRIGTFFGAEVRDRLYDLDVTQGPARLHGFIADPAIERGNAKMQYLFLNGRWIRDRSLGHGCANLGGASSPPIAGPSSHRTGAGSPDQWTVA